MEGLNTSLRSRVSVAAADLNGDGFADIICGAGAGGGPAVNVANGRDGALVWGLFAYDPSFSGGVRVAAADVDGDGLADVVTSAGGGAVHDVAAFRGLNGSRLDQFFANDPSFGRGLFDGGW